MTRVAILLALLTAACSGDPAAENRAEPVARTTPARSPTATTFAPQTDRLPKPLLGTWTADPSGRCTPATELRIVVAPAEIRFYESVARVLSVTQTDPHRWQVIAETVGEGETRRQDFAFYLGELGGLTRVQPPAPDLTYQRCKAPS